jgi:hypothetical protein
VVVVFFFFFFWYGETLANIFDCRSELLEIYIREKGEIVERFRFNTTTYIYR